MLLELHDFKINHIQREIADKGNMAIKTGNFLKKIYYKKNLLLKY